MTKLKSFAILATLLFAFASTAAATEGKWVHIKVHDGNDEQVTVNLPLTLVTAASAMIPEDVRADVDHQTRIALDDVEMTWEDLRNLWQEIKNAPEATFVSVRSKDESLDVKKVGNFLLITTPDNADTKTQIDVKFPLAVVDALFSGPEGTLNFEAALSKLADYDSQNLVSVRDGDQTVRIWIDDVNVSD